MEVGRKIYYDKATGNVLLDTGESSGSVRETSIEEDFASYRILSERLPTTVGVLRIPYGQDSEKFGKYSYRIDPVTELIAWDLTPIQEEEEAQRKTLEQQVATHRRMLTDAYDAIAYIGDQVASLRVEINALKGGRK